jgi:hypothetical protein
MPNRVCPPKKYDGDNGRAQRPKRSAAAKLVNFRDITEAESGTNTAGTQVCAVQFVPKKKAVAMMMDTSVMYLHRTNRIHAAEGFHSFF